VLHKTVNAHFRKGVAYIPLFGSSIAWRDDFLRTRGESTWQDERPNHQIPVFMKTAEISYSNSLPGLARFESGVDFPHLEYAPLSPDGKGGCFMFIFAGATLVGGLGTTSSWDLSADSILRQCK
jgi:hypothetical protein